MRKLQKCYIKLQRNGCLTFIRVALEVYKCKCRSYFLRCLLLF